MVNLPDDEAARSRAPEGGDRATKGAVYVEFLIAFLPVFFFFLSLVQLMFVQTANLIVKHAAVKAARAAVVVLHDDPKFYGGVPMGSFTGERKSSIERAAKIPLAPLGVNAAAVKIAMNGSHGRDDLVKVTVEFDYTCGVPWGRFTVCGFGTKKLVGEAAMPNQGADFQY
jgi:hypothetical protein